MNNHSMVSTDYKSRWGGVLENPYFQKLQRHCLDGFKVTGLKKILEPFQFTSCLDVCCGMGECALAKDVKYSGLDNSLSYIQFARQEYPGRSFLVGDARALPFVDGTFEASYFIAAAHHFDDGDLQKILTELIRVSRNYVIVDDSVKTSPQNGVREFFHRLDRGGMFRSSDELESIILRFPQVKVISKVERKTFPGIHLHATFIIELKKGSHA